MAFQVKNWTRISSSGNTDVVLLQDGTLAGAPAMFAYISGTDTTTTIAGADYFADQANELNQTDLIYVAGTDTEVFLTVVGVSVGPPRTVVTAYVTPATGDVTGPSSATDNALVRFNGTTGKLVQNGVILESDSGDLTLVNSIANASGLIATPSYTFTGDVDSGMWRSAANTVDFSTNAFRVLQLVASPALSVNYTTLTASATGNPVLWTAAGSDSNIGIYAIAKGTGTFGIRGNTNAGTLTLWNAANTFATQLKAAAVAQTDTYTLPTALPGSSGYVLSATTAGVMSWVSNGAASWVDQTTTPVTVAANTSYSANNAGLVTLNMPATASFGDEFEIVGQGAGGWLLRMNTGQVANLGNSPTTTAGSLASTNRYDSVKLVCTVANTTFNVISGVGNLTVA